MRAGHKAVLSGPAGGYVGYALTTRWAGVDPSKLQVRHARGLRTDGAGAVKTERVVGLSQWAAGIGLRTKDVAAPRGSSRAVYVLRARGTAA